MDKDSTASEYFVGSWTPHAQIELRGTVYHSGEPVSVSQIPAKELADYVTRGILVTEPVKASDKESN